jgi:1-aminocyclopropane-1-carboxylate deaminase
MLLPSPISTFKFRNKTFLIKRDDLIDTDFSGNKARKFYYYFNYLKQNPKITKIVSYGSNQSNAMYSLSVLAKLFNKELTYYVNHLSTYLRKTPTGNYKQTLLNGTKVTENPEIVEHLKNNKIKFDENTLFIKEGGAVQEAEFGIKMLADELKKYENYSLFLPSGTGVTALYLQKHFKGKVYTCSTVGDDEYLIKQWQDLEINPNFYPTIIPKHKKFHFGKLYRENYEIWLELKKAGIEFDLLYDPIGWQVVINNVDILGEKIIYIHQGGLKGNESMIKRYERKYPTHLLI